jgi:hypothetical protein
MLLGSGVVPQWTASGEKIQSILPQFIGGVKTVPARAREPNGDLPVKPSPGPMHEHVAAFEDATPQHAIWSNHAAQH